jgi:type IX secretion system PorP/SprF family membrane protein
MKTKSILFALTFIFIFTSKVLAQDAQFTQWENMPLYLNPALTGNFDGQIRLRAQYRDQWRSILKDAAYKTSAVCADYKFSAASARKISVGALFFHDKAGSLDFRNNGFHITSSVVQSLGNPDLAHHSIALGFDVGWANRKIDGNAQWPGWPPPPPTDINEKTSYPDVSAGLLWNYESNTHFSFQLGSALHHINQPNVSLLDNGDANLKYRLNLHGKIEIPVVHSFSIVPSILFSSQEPSEQLTFGFNNRWYPQSSSPNFVQLGIFAKSTKSYNGTNINVYVLSGTVEINSFLLGFSFDRFDELESNAYEFSVGYTFGMHDTMEN